MLVISASAWLFAIRALKFLPAMPPIESAASLAVMLPWNRARSMTPATLSPTRPPTRLLIFPFDETAVFVTRTFEMVPP
ncbi:hypothetical protein [Burkholderia pyrrocinia]|uniref:hypothetical protein n=1 Tax=Burkholderia pyrrocinia TaxID=60550 RepID=UPI001FB732DF|nr:hypothetical protein [Burkholderia pyrrocinia]